VALCDLGGGASDCDLNNCTLDWQRRQRCGWMHLAQTVRSWGKFGSAWEHDGAGGGATGSTLHNCTLTGNSAVSGGGAAGCALNNCVVYFNTA